jgi:nuclear pore complex protein Nup133
MPSEALGVYTEKLDSRFEKFEKGYRDKLMDAMRWEDGNLRKHIDKHRLDDWAKDTQKMAEDAVNHRYDDETAEGANSIVSPSKTKAANGSARNGAY